MEIETRPDERGYALIANFEGGFASGWRMAVSESYKDALDIKLTPRRLSGKTAMLWTQGRSYDFHVGDTIHDCKEAYKNWEKGLTLIGISVQIISASPSRYVTSEVMETKAKEIEVSVRQGKGGTKTQMINDGITFKRLKLDHGVVQFQVYRPDSDRSKLVAMEVIKCTQDDFVAFLQTGIVRAADNRLLDLFANAA